MEDFITTGYNIILFQLKQTQLQQNPSSAVTTVLGTTDSAVGGTQLAPPPINTIGNPTANTNTGYTGNTL